MSRDSASETIFITGATGAVGEQLVLVYLLQRTDTHLRLLLRTKGSATVEARLAGLADYCTSRGVPPDRFRKQVRAVTGDITMPGLGLSEAEASELRQRVTGVVHSAATTRFSVGLAEARRINVQGTENVLEFAQTLPHLTRMAYLSTAFVAGRRVGLIEEEELEHDCGFVNYYEQSKYEAELAIRRAWTHVPLTVYRLSTLLGDSITGEVRAFAAIHSCLRLYYRGLGAALPGEPNSLIHVLPVDYAARTVFRLFEDFFDPGATLHVVAPTERLMTLAAFLDACSVAFEDADPGWHRRGIEVPPIVNLRTFGLMRDTASIVSDPTLQRVMALLSYFAPQQAFPKDFRSSLPAELEPPEPLADYLPRVIRFCIEKGWGRERQQPAGAPRGGRAE